MNDGGGGKSWKRAAGREVGKIEERLLNRGEGKVRHNTWCHMYGKWDGYIKKLWNSAGLYSGKFIVSKVVNFFMVPRRLSDNYARENDEN